MCLICHPEKKTLDKAQIKLDKKFPSWLGEVNIKVISGPRLNSATYSDHCWEKYSSSYLHKVEPVVEKAALVEVYGMGGRHFFGWVHGMGKNIMFWMMIWLVGLKTSCHMSTQQS